MRKLEAPLQSRDLQYEYCGSFLFMNEIRGRFPGFGLFGSKCGCKEAWWAATPREKTTAP
jgi:hypothetical protein